MFVFLFFFNDTATTEIYTLSLHDALPIYEVGLVNLAVVLVAFLRRVLGLERPDVRLLPGIHPARAEEELRPAALARDEARDPRSEEHTSELQSRQYLVCRLLLEKKKKNTI